MTTIAYDGQTLAADRQSTWGTTPTWVRKAFRTDHPEHGAWLWACSGLTEECDAFHAWAHGSGVKATMKDTRVLAVHEDGSIWTMGDGLIWTRLHVDCWAIGSGCDYALGAMHAGACAKAAVLIASKLDVHTGGGVDCVRF